MKKNILNEVCMVCGIRLRHGTKCSSCGYDGTKEYEYRLTLGPLSEPETSVVKKRQEYQEKYYKRRPKPLSIGDTVLMGEYPQSRDGKLMKILWQVLAVDGEFALLQSVYGIDMRPYNEDLRTCTWSNSTIQKWLNKEFFDGTFSVDEKEAVLCSVVKAEKNPKSRANPGEDSNDRVFLLSISEAEGYYPSEMERTCKPSAYVLAKGISVNPENGCANWWLRTPGGSQSIATRISGNGSVNYAGDYVSAKGIMVRPAMWIDMKLIK